MAEPENEPQDIGNDSDMAQPKTITRRESYDIWALEMREKTIEMRDGFERMGWMAPRKERFTEMRKNFYEIEFTADPATDWEYVCNEIDLILIAMRDTPSERISSNAELSKKVRATLSMLEKVKKSLYELNHNIEFNVAEILSKCGGQSGESLPDIEKLIRWMQKIEIYLSENRQSPRWKQKDLREYRVELATKLISLFEGEFNEEAKPVGGSHFRPLNETNNWTKFFQACIYFRTGEVETPDRQAVLWEAYRNR